MKFKKLTKPAVMMLSTIINQKFYNIEFIIPYITKNFHE
jgi:hypothetical protein